MATLRSCCRILAGLERSGVMSAGNGSTMRAPVIGVFFADDAPRRRDFGEALARVTHLDPRAVEGSLFAAEVAALCTHVPPSAPRAALVHEALAVVSEPSLRSAILQGVALAQGDASPEDVACTLGNTGFVIHTLGVASYALVRAGNDPLDAIVTAVAVGGDTDTSAAIVGAWTGALHGDSALPRELIARLTPGPFGERHLRALARDLARRQQSDDAPPAATYFPPLAMLRNLLLFPVVLLSGVRVLLGR
jgi:ADP-ribosylglycohydrolase